MINLCSQTGVWEQDSSKTWEQESSKTWGQDSSRVWEQDGVSVREQVHLMNFGFHYSSSPNPCLGTLFLTNIYS